MDHPNEDPVEHGGRCEVGVERRERSGVLIPAGIGVEW